MACDQDLHEIRSLDQTVEQNSGCRGVNSGFGLFDRNQAGSGGALAALEQRNQNRERSQCSVRHGIRGKAGNILCALVEPEKIVGGVERFCLDGF